VTAASGSTEGVPDLRVPDLTTREVGKRVMTFEVLDSTNTYALEHGEPGDVIVADRQTAGRGRLGRTWYSAPGLGLWFTVVVADITDGLTFAGALAVRDALDAPGIATIKWPNDVLCAGRKVCGILAEHRRGVSALGIGINVHHRREDFPGALRETAGSVAGELGGTWRRGELLGALLHHLDESIILLQAGELGHLRTRFQAACDLVGRVIRVGDVKGQGRELSASGGLVLDSDTGPRTVHAGEIEILA